MVRTEPGDREGPSGTLTGPPRDIVVIGASRGGIEAIRGIVRGLAAEPAVHAAHRASHQPYACEPISCRPFPEPAHFRLSTGEMAYALSAAAFT